MHHWTRTGAVTLAAALYIGICRGMALVMIRISGLGYFRFGYKRSDGRVRRIDVQVVV